MLRITNQMVCSFHNNAIYFYAFDLANLFQHIIFLGNLYRSSYAAFVFSHTSGLLEPGAKVRIPVSFNPMSEGSYSQFWDLEVSQ